MTHSPPPTLFQKHLPSSAWTSSGARAPNSGILAKVLISRVVGWDPFIAVSSMACSYRTLSHYFSASVTRKCDRTRTTAVRRSRPGTGLRSAVHLRHLSENNATRLLSYCRSGALEHKSTVKETCHG